MRGLPLMRAEEAVNPHLRIDLIASYLLVETVSHRDSLTRFQAPAKTGTKGPRRCC